MKEAVAFLEAGQLDEALARAEQIMASLGPNWEATRRGAQTMAQALWIASMVHEVDGDLEKAWTRGRRAIELYAHHRMDTEELDIRAARELAAASARLRKLR